MLLYNTLHLNNKYISQANTMTLIQRFIKLFIHSYNLCRVSSLRFLESFKFGFEFG